MTNDKVGTQLEIIVRRNGKKETIFDDFITEESLPKIVKASEEVELDEEARPRLFMRLKLYGQEDVILDHAINMKEVRAAWRLSQDRINRGIKAKKK